MSGMAAVNAMMSVLIAGDEIVAANQVGKKGITVVIFYKIPRHPKREKS